MTPDKRYVASLGQESAVHYKDFFESDSLRDAQAQAEQTSARAFRKAIVYDRKEQAIVSRYDPGPPAEPPPEKGSKRERKKRGK